MNCGWFICDWVYSVQIISKRLQIIGSTLRARPLRQKERLIQEFAEYALPRFEDGTFKPIVDKVFKFEDVVEAHKYLEGKKNKGKIILKIEHWEHTNDICYSSKHVNYVKPWVSSVAPFFQALMGISMVCLLCWDILQQRSQILPISQLPEYIEQVCAIPPALQEVSECSRYVKKIRSGMTNCFGCSLGKHACNWPLKGMHANDLE